MKKKNLTLSEQHPRQRKKRRQQASSLVTKTDSLLDAVFQKLDEVKKRPESQTRIHYKVQALSDDQFENFLDKKYDGFKENTLYVYPAIVEKQTSFVECYFISHRSELKYYEVSFDALGVDLSEPWALRQENLDKNARFFLDCATYKADLFSLRQLLDQMQKALKETQKRLKKQLEENPEQAQQHLEEFKVDALRILSHPAYQEEIRHHRSQALWKPLVKALDDVMTWLQKKIGYDSDFTVNFFSTATQKKIAAAAKEVNDLTLIKKSV